MGSFEMDHRDLGCLYNHPVQRIHLSCWFRMFKHGLPAKQFQNAVRFGLPILKSVLSEFFFTFCNWHKGIQNGSFWLFVTPTVFLTGYDLLYMGVGSLLWFLATLLLELAFATPKLRAWLQFRRVDAPRTGGGLDIHFLENVSI